MNFSSVVDSTEITTISSLGVFSETRKLLSFTVVRFGSSMIGAILSRKDWERISLWKFWSKIHTTYVWNMWPHVFGKKQPVKRVPISF